MKKTLIMLVFITLTQQLQAGMWDSMANSASSAWEKTKDVADDAADSKAIDKTKKYGSDAWKKTKEVTNDISKSEAVQATKDYGSKAWDFTKIYSKKAYDASKETYEEATH